MTEFKYKAIIWLKTVATLRHTDWFIFRRATNEVYVGLLIRTVCLRTQGKYFLRVPHIWSVEPHSYLQHFKLNGMDTDLRKIGIVANNAPTT